jgi:hypothetical protein
LDGILAALSPLEEVDESLKAAEREHAELLAVEAHAKELELLIDEIANRGHVADFHQAQGAALADLQGPPALEETVTVEEHARKLEGAARRVAAEERRSASLVGLAPPPDLEDEGGLLSLGRGLSSAVRKVQSVDGAVRSLATLHEPPGLDDPAPLAESIERLAKAALAEAQVRRSIKSLDGEFDGVDDQINAWLWANPNCPTCGAETTREALLSGAHAHVAAGGGGGHE